MSTNRQLTFGGGFRRLRIDLKKMNSDTRKLYLDSAGQDAWDCHDYNNIQTVEGRIIYAVSTLPARDLFKSMTIHHSALHHAFSHHWEKLQAMTSRWQVWRSAWREHVEQHGDLINDREWKQDAKIMKKLFDAFMHSEPKAFEQHQDWTDDYHAPESGVTKVEVQSLRLDADFKPIDTLIPPFSAVVPETQQTTFGYAYRRLRDSILALVWSITIDDGWITLGGQKPSSIRLKQLEIIRDLKSFQAMKLQKKSLFAHMVYVGIKSSTHLSNFFEAWHRLLEVCSRWNAKLAGVLICVNHCKWGDSRWPDDRKRDTFNLLSWQCDWETLNGIARVFKESEPKGLLDHPGWTENKCYTSCLTTAKVPDLSFSEKTGAQSQRMTSDPTDITFGGAWRNLVQDIKELKAINISTGVVYFGLKDPRDWQRIFELIQRITPRVQTLPKHPLFTSMIIGPSECNFSISEFWGHWNTLEVLCKGWEYWKSRFLQDVKWEEMLLIPTKEWDHKYEDAIHWERIMHALGPLDLADAWPEGHKEKPEWTEDTRRVAELMEQKESPAGFGEAHVDEEQKVPKEWDQARNRHCTM